MTTTNTATGAGNNEAQKSLQALLKQQEELTARIEEQRKASRADALTQVKQLCTDYEITATELKGSLKVKRAASTQKSGTRSKSAAARKR